MSRDECCEKKDTGSSVNVNIDVTRIVKYVCISGVFIVGIIFGTKYFHKIVEDVNLFCKK
ncbi:hypothetical protein H0486_12920 [Lachnospiraceae bacterium MD1]|jgi:hypothetical protein|uniref:Uncharacterized protein n=1 Tax=Variimorphobacter saccharofermentans TaxID=2755051 RepID=A0A839K1J9_9FIRM|nr:hypothetical protein [Variimorphobacter saccharofermentans]MBB2183775.1 hypothetical protein [Variimorphobacter saccharofermentans]